MVDTHLIAEKMHLLEPKTKISMLAVRWATNRSEAAKIDIFTECSVIPQISLEL